VWGGFSVNNATLNRFFSLHYLLPFILAVLAILHLMTIHTHGSGNPLGFSGNSDRLPFHPYFTFKDLVTILLFFLVLSFVVFYMPNALGQPSIWPVKKRMIICFLTLCAISWKYILYFHIIKMYHKTISVSDLKIKQYVKCNAYKEFVQEHKNPGIVKYYDKIYNQRITKVKNRDFQILRVGISETLRTLKFWTNDNFKNIIIFNQKRFYNSNISIIENKNLNNNINDNHNNHISLKFKEWFAGITDGDGYIYVNKDMNVGYELTLPFHDEKVLRIIQNKFGGNIKPRTGVKAIRYRTQKKETVIKIIHSLNGLVINNIRLSQLHKACLALNIPIKDNIKPTNHSGYLSGLLDADGSINMYKYTIKDTFRYQLTISISNKYKSNLEFLVNIMGGKIYFDKSQNGHYIWKANSKVLHLKLYEYFKEFPPKTIKYHRTYLIPEFHELNAMKIYRDIHWDSIKFKKWEYFLQKWNNKKL
jgi:ubiquinol-cytochrome c reductase cytochrome b subunit